MNDKWRCNACGYIQDGGILIGYCPSCGAKGQMFLTNVNNVQQIEEVELTDENTTWKGHKIADSMSADQIQEYLKCMIETEKIVYEMTNLFIRMKYKCPQEPSPPVAPIKPVSGRILGTIFSTFCCAFACAIGFVLFWLSISVITFFVVTLSSLSDEFGDTVIYGSAGVIGAIYCIFLVYLIWPAFCDQRKKQQEFKRQLAEYNDERRQYEEDVRCFPQKQLQWKYYVILWKQEYHQLEIALDESKSKLEQMYAIGVLAPKYRNYTAVCSLFDYFQAGSCETVKEAYNKYDQELLLGHIVTRLDKILNSLDEIKRNQNTLYTAIQSSNLMLGQLIQRTDEFYTQTSRQLTDMEQSVLSMEAKTSELLQNSAITAYCSEASQKELSFIRRMSQYEGIIGSSWSV